VPNPEPDLLAPELPLLADSGDPAVLVAPIDRFAADGSIRQGCFSDDALLPTQGVSWMTRSVAETDPRFKQIVPYVVVRRGLEYWCYRRSNAGSEGKLYHRKSIGVGGHVERIDWLRHAGLVAALSRAAVRELREEIDFGEGLNPPLYPRGFHGAPVAFVNDDASEVGRFHFGVVFLLDVLPGVEIVSRDPGVIPVGFLRPAQLVEVGNRGEFETWSYCVASYLLGGGGLPR
jgi:predicted NUDIX family phosphoesterase